MDLASRLVYLAFYPNVIKNDYFYTIFSIRFTIIILLERIFAIYLHYINFGELIL